MECSVFQFHWTRLRRKLALPKVTSLSSDLCLGFSSKVAYPPGYGVATSWVRIAFVVAPGYERTKVSLLGTDTRDGRSWVRNPRKRSVLGTGAPGYERAKVRSWVRIGPKVVAPRYGFAREKVGTAHRGTTRTPLIIWAHHTSTTGLAGRICGPYHGHRSPMFATLRFLPAVLTCLLRGRPGLLPVTTTRHPHQTSTFIAVIVRRSDACIWRRHGRGSGVPKTDSPVGWCWRSIGKYRSNGGQNDGNRR